MYDDTGANWLSTSRVALFPKPRFVRASAAFVAPVPPSEIPTAPLLAFWTSLPIAGMVTRVPLMVTVMFWFAEVVTNVSHAPMFSSYSLMS
ncbi:TPA: hypothetical protein I4G70_20285 [Enterobacter hormaechei subsp. xiangfangensis]|nr:hypothetical protein [Enterobacter hormaechei subsp. xiangfangensis]